MREKIILSEKAKIKRNICVERIESGFIIHEHEKIGCNTYLLEGKYTYDEVVKLNNLTTFYAGFGYCHKLGPIAFIGIPNLEYAQKSGCFQYEVKQYGIPFDSTEYYFNAYNEEKAKEIQDYTVYGFNGIEIISKVAAISKLNYILDSRYKAKRLS